MTSKSDVHIEEISSNSDTHFDRVSSKSDVTPQRRLSAYDHFQTNRRSRGELPPIQHVNGINRMPDDNNGQERRRSLPLSDTVSGTKLPNKAYVLPIINIHDEIKGGD